MHGVKSYKFEYKLETESNYKLGEEISTSEKSCSYMYIDLKQQVLNNLKVTVTDNLGNTKEAMLDVTPDITKPMNPTLTDTSLAGKTVNYAPKEGQVYNTEDGEWTTSKNDSTNYPEYSGWPNFQYFSSGSVGNNGDYTGQWTIWGLDDLYIYIISYRATSKVLYLNGTYGYNNGVTLLDKICDNVFTDKITYPESRGQNIKLEQILSLVTNECYQKNYYKGYYGYKGNSRVTTYPYIWNEYEKSDISLGQGGKDWEQNRSKAYNLTTASFSEEEISYAPYSNAWHWNDNTGSWNYKPYWKNEAYWDILIGDNYGQGLFTSSRYVMNAYGILGFGLQSFGGGPTTANIVVYDNGTWYEQAAAGHLKPIISFPRSMYELQEQSDGTYNIVKK